MSEDSLTVIGTLRNGWSDSTDCICHEGPHSHCTWLDVPITDSNSPGLKKNRIGDYISEFIRSHHKTCEGREFEVTIKLLPKTQGKGG